ncbi:DUF1802 family protein [Leptothoe spongobia TAU-MAC 1115]|uniref:DUF1802 family protein n=1 Tax=Leptothoe spongobia TAU-MAC 1115 TaxID=1967444 RepID=A0A947DFK6_9CYAN|nr:DUF1802 family protein [Leptothoe spongobia TAU-MAC 1115]
MLQHALKEWSIAVDALTQGRTILLFRKGGIREVGQQFIVPHQRVWLYPTYEHQKPHLLKPQWAAKVMPVDSGRYPTQVTLLAWAEISHVWTVKTLDKIEALLPFHIWNEQFVTERFCWKPSQPLHILLLRVHCLAIPIQIDWQSVYGGCRSWLTFEAPLDETPSTPALDKQTWATTVQQIHEQIATLTSSELLQANEII